MTAAQRSLPITPDNYHERAHDFAVTIGENRCTQVIAPGSDEWLVWHQYFDRHLGWMPAAMRMMIDGSPEAPREFTVPSQFPQAFDTSFAEDPAWKPIPQRKPLARQHHDSSDELRERFGADWGIKRAPMREARPYHPPTDEELLARHSKPRPDQQETEGVT